MKVQKNFIFVVMIVLLGLLLAACGGGESESPAEVSSDAGDTGSTESTSDESSGETVAGEEIIGVYASGRSMANIDPYTTVNDEEIIMLNVYETLTFYGADGEVLPKLAESWEVSDDGLEWTFKLREGVQFHDGETMTAEDVKNSFERSQASELFPHLFNIAGIEVVDDSTVKFTTHQVVNLPLILTSRFGTYVVSPMTADKESEWFNTGNSAGTGPYMVDTFEPNQRTILSQFPDYWQGWEDGQVTKVSIEQVEDATTREQMVRQGDADATYDLDFDTYAALMDDKPDGFRIDIIPSFLTVPTLANTLRPPLDNPLARQALAHTFPYDVIVENTHGGLGSPATGVVPDAFWQGDPGLTVVEYDLDKAKALLEEAGVPEGTEIDFVHFFGEPEQQKIGELWRAELAKVGIEMNIQGVPIEGIVDMLGDPTTAYHYLTLDWWNSYPSPYDYSASLFHSTNFMFPLSFLNNPDYDALMDEGLANEVTDPAKAQESYAAAQQLLLDEGVIMPSVQKPGVIAISDELQGFEHNPGYLTTVFWYDVRK